MPRPVRAWAVCVVVGIVSVACGSGEDIITPPATGTLVVRVTTSGVPPAAGGYTVSIDGEDPRAIGANGSLTTDVPVGTHTVELSGLPGSCSLDGENPRAVEVVAGGSADLSFAVACPAPLGAVTVTTATTGSVPDPDGYTLAVDGAPEGPVGTNATVILPGLSAGPHALLLSDVAPNCTVAGENPRAIEVVPGSPLNVAFEIACVVGGLRWTEVSGNTVADLPDVWGTGPDNVFIVGEQDTDDGGGVASVIVRFDGTTWQRQFRQTDLRLRAVWGSSPTDIFAVGFRFFTSGAVILHYDGTRWAEGENLVGQLEDFTLASVWGTAANDVYAVGAAFDGEFGRALILHFDGVSWQRMPGPATTSPGLNDVWARSPTDVYAVGQDEVTDPRSGVILHFDGTVWTPVLQEPSLVLNGVQGSGTSDVFAVGFEIGENFEVTGTVRHFDGATWTRMDIPPVGVLQEVWSSAPEDVYAVGDDGLILHYDGTTWTETRPSDLNLLGVWGSSPADVFVVGNRGIILRGTP